MVRIDDAVDAAAADRMPALALTDLANVFGMVKFYKAARAASSRSSVAMSGLRTKKSATRRIASCCSASRARAICGWPAG
jgi:DNA polymerase-3 subunit alpha